MTGTAIFDLDRTLTRWPTWTRFLFRTNRHRLVFWFKLPLLVIYMLAYKLGFLDRTAVKNRFLATLAWAGRERVEAAGRDFADVEIREGLRTGVPDLLAQHRDQGHKLYMATAASEFIAEPIARHLGFDGVICTRIAWPEEPGGAPAIQGLNCYDAEKLRRVKDLFAEDRLPGPLFFYSDHVSDLELLLLADTGIAVNPSAKLRKSARKSGLQIMDLDIAQAESAVERESR